MFGWVLEKRKIIWKKEICVKIDENINIVKHSWLFSFIYKYEFGIVD